MKKIGLTFSLVLTLGGNAMACGWCCFWPSFSIGIGLGGIFGCSLGVGPGCYCYCGCGCPAYSCAYSRPAYAYSYAPAANYIAPPAAVPGPARAPEPSPWVPSTPGAGRWVPDPTPYSFTPAATATTLPEAKPALRKVVTMTRSRDGIPVYTISYLK